MSDTFGRYDIKESIGRGGMATVYLAHDPYFERDVALKVLPREFMHDELFYQRFEREAKLIAGLEHSAIVPVYDYGVQDDQPYLVMRYMGGGSLKSLLEEGRLEDDAIIRIVERVSAGLDRAHNRGIVHRDVKPGNIMFDQDGDAYLGDFGIARLSDATSFLTGTMPIGTPAFMAPEMADAGGLSPLVDIYALGIVAYMMLAGEHPFDADTPSGFVMAHLGKPVPDIRHKREDLSGRVQRVIERCMAKDPVQRYQTAGAFASDLREALQQPYSREETDAHKPVIFEPSQDYDGALISETAATTPMNLVMEEATPYPIEVPDSPETLGFEMPAAPPAAAVERRSESKRGPRWLWIMGGLATGGIALVIVLIGFLALSGRLMIGGASETPEPGETPLAEATEEVSDGGSQDGGASGVPTLESGIPANMDVSRDTIIICMAQEPDTLYSVTGTMRVTSTVLMAADLRAWINDRAYFYEAPALLNGEFPSVENGDVDIVGSGSNMIMTVTYRWRDDITWSDGEPFTVDDILFTREVVIDPDSGAIFRGGLEDMDFVKVDDYTLRVTYPRGTLDPTYFLPPIGSAEGGAVATVLPEHVLGNLSPEQIIESDYARLPNPTLGPYEFVEWDEGDSITLSAREDWYGETALVPNLIFRFIFDENQLQASLLAGECDFATSDGIDSTLIPFLQQSAEQDLIAYDARPGTVWEHIDFNTAPPPGAENNGYGLFADRRVRQAVAFGTNREHMADVLTYGEVEHMTSYLPSDHWAYNLSLPELYDYDPDQARELLDQAGWLDSDGDGFVEAHDDLRGVLSCQRGSWSVPEGTELAVNFHTTTGNSMREQMVTLLQSDMADIGIRMTIDLLPASVWFTNDGPLFTRTYQIGNFAWVTNPFPSPLGLYLGQNVYQTPQGDIEIAERIIERDSNVLADLGLTAREFISGRPTESELDGYDLLYSEAIPDEVDDYEGSNVPGWCNSDSDRMLVAAEQAITLEDQELYLQEHQYVFAEDVPSLPLFQRVIVDAYAVDLCGPDLGPANTQTWNIERWYFCTP